MFAARFFAGRYYARRYFPAIGASIVASIIVKPFETIVLKVIQAVNVIKAAIGETNIAASQGVNVVRQGSGETIATVVVNESTVTKTTNEAVVVKADPSTIIH